MPDQGLRPKKWGFPSHGWIPISQIGPAKIHSAAPPLANRAQRCLVPFTAFAEPLQGQGRAEAWFGLSGQSIGAFAGLWRHNDGGNVFAFLTCEPNPLVAPIHPKAMPVILQPEDYQAWLDGADAKSLAQPFPSQLMARIDQQIV